jgi:transcriptional regulator with XRE-family HTH domain
MRVTPGERLRDIRKRRHLTMEQLAAMVRANGSNCSLGWISMFERGLHDAGISKIRAVCRALDITPMTITGDARRRRHRSAT